MFRFAAAAGLILLLASGGAAADSVTQPFGGHSDEVTVDNSAGGVRLAATFRAPAGKGPFPAVLLINGAGPQTRGAFERLAARLLAYGIASLDFDKRGCGGSTGDLQTASLNDLIGDSTALVAYLKTRADVNRAKIGVLGGSEGSLVAAAIAAKDHSLAFVVLLGVVAARTDQLALYQWEREARAGGVTEAEIPKGREAMKQLYAAAIAARTDEEARASGKRIFAPIVARGAVTQEQSDALAAMVSSRQARERLAYDPATNLRAIRAHVLAMTGTRDLQIPASVNFPPLRAALAGNRDVTILEPEGINHILQKAKIGTIEEWSQLGPPFSDEASLETIAGWIQKRTR
ncbi:MAG TPA: CocE/NonD family hydrolase [Rhizomicrobium sp.]|nr:CocE/NonD family hydrolase [Rhizomicrobium sp.]